MRPTEEIYHSIVQYERADVSESLKASIKAAMIVYAKECLEEAAKKASNLIERDSILKLIKELK